jgi:RNA polymerase sigma factor (TIGR02999 family)
LSLFDLKEHSLHAEPNVPPIAKAQAHVTLLLQAAASGDPRASSELLPLVYEELRKLAQANMGREMGGGAGQTLQPTALVHEAFLRLVGGESEAAKQGWNSRGHFFGAAALAMRRILVERARARNAQKRGGGLARVELREDAVVTDPGEGPGSDQHAAQLIALDAALARLETLDERAGRVVMLRYFAGLSIEQTAVAMGISEATVKKSWVFARAWLNREIGAALA